MIFIPYATDAPLYHRPYGTIGAMIACITVTALAETGVVDTESLALVRHDGLHPEQWVSSCLLHFGWIHLVGNCLLLWPLGLLVEGKVGTLRFIAIFLGIGGFQNLIEQLLFLEPDFAGTEVEMSAGNSAILYGLVVVCWLWAPRNHFRVAYIFFIRFGVFNITVFWLGVWFIAVQLFWATLGSLFGLSLLDSSEGLHLMGAAVGLAVGFAMLKFGLVNCEGWDLLSIRAGKHEDHLTVEGKFKVKKPPSRKRAVHVDEPAEERLERLLDEQQTSLTLFREYLASGDAAVAREIHDELLSSARHQKIPPPEITSLARRRLIQLLTDAGCWADAIPYIDRFWRDHPDQSNSLLLDLAEHFLASRQPSKTLKVISRLPETLNPGDEVRRAPLLVKARALAATTLEFDE